MLNVLGLALLISVSSFKILPGKFHQGGTADATLLSTNEEAGTMTVKLEYEVYKRALVPVPSEYLKGDTKEDLPLEFKDERGYLNLEAVEKMELPDATLIHMGREDVGQFKDSHKVRIKAKNGKSDTYVYYHPQASDLGWVKIVLVMHTTIPLLKTYSIEAVLRE